MKTIVKEVLLKLIPIAISGIVAWSFGDSATGVQKWIIGLLVTCVGLLIVEFIRISTRMEDFRKSLDGLSNTLADRIIDDWKRAQLLRQSRTLDESGLQNSWLQLLWSVQKSYSATNHIPDASIYSHGYANCALGIQGLKREISDIPITKVFIVNDDAEFAAVKGTMKKQHEKSFRIHYIRYDKLPKHDHLETIDFGIFDSEVVLLWRLDPVTRKPGAGQILTGEGNVARYQAWFTQLLRESTPFQT